MYFTDWIESQLRSRGWNPAELARRSGITPPQVSRVLSGARGPGPEFCLGVARAFQMPPEDVYRMAGLLPAAVNDHKPTYHLGNNLSERLAKAFGRLDIQDQERLVDLAERLAGIVAGRIIGDEGE
jgi:transcriptional regulator with XRE-family HTH domain